MWADEFPHLSKACTNTDFLEWFSQIKLKSKCSGTFEGYYYILGILAEFSAAHKLFLLHR